jgi:hypothetical protein
MAHINVIQTGSNRILCEARDFSCILFEVTANAYEHLFYHINLPSQHAMINNL